MKVLFCHSHLPGRRASVLFFGLACCAIGAATMLLLDGHHGPTVAYAQAKVSTAEQHILDAFHQWFYDNSKRTWVDTKWFGVEVQKDPFDLWIYQELLFETKPDVLIEAGTAHGGSAYFFACLFDLMHKGRVYTIDIDTLPVPTHKRITYLHGSSTGDDIVRQVKKSIKRGEKVMVSLDSDHSKAHVLNELNIYSNLVSVGQYMVVEDSNINGHPVNPGFGPGPWEAIEDFLKADDRFVIDEKRERFGFTFFPHGWLKRVR
jgi:cephalosporin hydroxylase